MEKQREDEPPPPAPAPEPIVPDWVHETATRDYTPQAIKDQETRRIMRKARGGRER